MTFTDEDLKRLEKLPDNIVITLGVGPSVKLKAIIARLEAAEACIDVKADSYELWRKAAGK